MPLSGLFGIAGASDTVLKADVWTELVFIDDMFEILQDFRPICVERGPVCLQDIKVINNLCNAP